MTAPDGARAANRAGDDLEPCPYRPADLPDVRLALRTHWEPGGLYHLAAFAAGGPGSGLASLSGFDERTLTDAELFWVSPDTCATVKAAASTYPSDTTLDESFLPARSGFAVFGEPFVGLDAEHGTQTLRVDAICWGPVNLRSRTSGAQRRGVAISSYQWMPDVERLVPLGRGDWLFGRPLDAQSFPDDPIDASNLASVIEDRALLATLASLVAHPALVAETRDPLPRPTRRRSVRAGIDPDRVRVRSLRLRGEGDDPAGGPGTGPEHRHRWIVSGHWRSQPYGPGRALRRPTWIAEHVKGPDGAPLLDPSRRVTRL